mmetsp:Transcript_60883/g.73168  ORF Transcript_60883/g.73168 Transcript_60883/m.73168 type:complete len:351 (-) Transcript_60883:293-1345(-)
MNNDEGRHGDIEVVLKQLRAENNMLKEFLSSRFCSIANSSVDDICVINKDVDYTINSNTILDFEVKLKIVQEMIDGIKKKHQNKKISQEKLVNALTTVIEETDERIVDLRKDAFDFKKEVVVNGEDPKTGQTISEKIIRYYEVKERKRATLVEKLRFNNSSLAAQIRKKEESLNQKEGGTSFHYIDFHQLEIENKKYRIQAEETKSKLITEKISFASKKLHLEKMETKIKELSGETSKRHFEIEKFSDHCQKTKDAGNALRLDISKERKRTKNNKLMKEKILSEHNNAKKQVEQKQQGGSVDDEPGIPCVENYMKQQAILYHLRDTVKSWERKVEIAEISVKQCNATDVH